MAGELQFDDMEYKSPPAGYANNPIEIPGVFAKRSLPSDPLPVITHSYKLSNIVKNAFKFRNNKRGSKLSHSQIFSLIAMMSPDPETFQELVCFGSEYRDKLDLDTKMKMLKGVRQSKKTKTNGMKKLGIAEFMGNYPSKCPDKLVAHGYFKWDGKMLSKTPLWAVDYAIQSLRSFPGYKLCEVERHVTKKLLKLAHASDGAYLIVGPLNKYVKGNDQVQPHNKQDVARQFVKVHGTPSEDALETVVLYIPSAAVFYSHFAPVRPLISSSIDSTVVDGPTQGRLIPLPSCWLRIRRHDGEPSKGGFLSKFTSVYSITWRQTPAKIYYQTHQLLPVNTPLVPDYEVNGAGPNFWRTSFTDVQKRKAYVELLRSSPTMRPNCKQNVRSLIFDKSHMSEKVFEVDVQKMIYQSEVNFRVVSKTKRENVVGNESTIRVRKVDLVSAQRQRFNQLLTRVQDRICRRKWNSCRKDDGMLGYMIPVGEHVHNGDICNYRGTEQLGDDGLLADLMVSYRKVMGEEFPFEVAVILNTARGFGVMPPDIMGGMNGVSSSINVSVDLANPPHQDVNDLNVSLSIWTEKIPGRAKNWYFVIPNVLVKEKVNDKTITYSGLRIKLCHGAAISWDGVHVRHCTSHTIAGKDNNVFGFFSGSHHPSLRLMEGMVEGDKELYLEDEDSCGWVEVESDEDMEM